MEANNVLIALSFFVVACFILKPIIYEAIDYVGDKIAMFLLRDYDDKKTVAGEKVTVEEVDLWPDNAAQAKFFYSEMLQRIRKMSRDDNETHISEWFEIIPLCEYVDEWYNTTHPDIPAASLKDRARKEAGLAC
jgi:hypothetical protein